MHDVSCIYIYIYMGRLASSHTSTLPRGPQALGYALSPVRCFCKYPFGE